MIILFVISKKKMIYLENWNFYSKKIISQQWKFVPNMCIFLMPK